MQVNLPPFLFYAIGALLIVFGALRIKYLGAPRVRRRPSDDDVESEALLDSAIEPE